MQSTEETNLKEQVQSYMKLALEEISAYEQGFCKAEKELMRCENMKVPSITLSEKQNEFLSEKPDYLKYLTCVKKFHTGVALAEEKQFKDSKAQLMYGREVIKNTLKQIHKV